MIEFHNVTKRYGKTAALDHLNFSISESGIYCLLGKNDTRKTTFMKLTAGYIKASEGMIAVGSSTVSTHHMPENVNFIESMATQFNMRIGDLLTMAAGLRDTFDGDFAREMAEKFGLDPHKKLKQLSLGMKAILNTILALANNAKIVLLDEPTLGFDVIMRK
ncbi:MAG: ATP-binding cassette domain-containing protein [Bifidobacteriaceae bacterium]|jgi:ABC-2 type transport system ATP-binding protein|nr:ATP-binding cassette domain-containing protein [Bifidobacteriaceae bacterium]